MKKMKYESPNALFGNGPCPTHPIVTDRLKSINTFFCVDGGADKLITMGYNPDVILGDLDSIKKKEKAYNSAIVYLEDQSKNDLEKSICWCANQGLKNWNFLGFPMAGMIIIWQTFYNEGFLRQNKNENVYRQISNFLHQRALHFFIQSESNSFHFYIH